MRKELSIVLAIVAMLALGTTQAQAQFRFGVRGGVVVNKVHFDRTILDSENRAGYTVGAMVDVGIPLLGFGVEAGVMFNHRYNQLYDSDGWGSYKRDYIEIPVHLRYKLDLPVVGKFISPIAFAGPNFAFLCHEGGSSYYSSRSTYVSMDVGAGIELFKHVQVTATYGIGLSKALRWVGLNNNQAEVDGKDRYWTIAATVLF